MRYIENLELREWVKESLRKTIFQKAHALAVQTGCEILVKLKDSTISHDCPLYYATESLHKDYRGDGVREEDGDMFVAGETGLPCFPMVDSATQSISETNGEQTRTAKTNEVSHAAVIPTQTDDPPVDESAVPMQLSVVNDPTTEQPTLNPKLENLSTDESFADQDPLSDVVVKLEKLDDEDDELNQRLGGGGPSAEEQASFGQFDNNSLSFGGDGGGANDDLGGRHYAMMSPKPYQCGVCQKAFRSVQVLQKHTQTFHMRPQHAGGRSRGRGRGLYHSRPSAHRQQQASQPRLMCVMCNRSFRSPDLLQDHMTRSHMSHATPVQLSTSQGSFDPASVQTSDAPSTATLQSLQVQQQQQSPMVVSSFQSLATDDSAQFQIPQTPQNPDAFNMSIASTSSSTFASPSASSSPRNPVFRYQTTPQGRASTSSGGGTSQATPSPSRTMARTSAGSDSNQITSRGIMSAILWMSGPVCSMVTMNSNGPKIYRRISLVQFKLAVELLQQAGLGSAVYVSLRQNDFRRSTLGVCRSTLMFIKKPPSQVQQQELNNLCTMAEYSSRYSMRPPAIILRKWRQRIVSLGLVPDDHFKE